MLKFILLSSKDPQFLLYQHFTETISAVAFLILFEGIRDKRATSTFLNIQSNENQSLVNYMCLLHLVIKQDMEEGLHIIIVLMPA